MIKEIKDQKMIEEKFKKFDKNNDYYGIYDQDLLLDIFYLYNNSFHLENKYLSFNFKNSYKENIFEDIKNIAKKPLQVMLYSTDERVKELKENGFINMRKCYEAEFSLKDLEENEFKDVRINKTTKNTEKGNIISRLAYEHYKITHSSINPLTATFEQFKQTLPGNIYYEEVNNEVINYTFIEENEICYFGTTKEETFKNFIYQIMLKKINDYKEVFFEADNTDQLAMILLSLFKNKKIDTFDTYILK
ncbi:hypothetical protein [Haploplasma axanthum]|uniref:Uncharacterized protein n=1 Tax=Haploplasma axanthum TaxID=29552 RepID=A0A449BBW8_HAPAX|nr:hypothetical protein [Haploplasma axanthum]VEU79935.1 Uncharacterised protein [Haploplasma axanthum]